MNHGSQTIQQQGRIFQVGEETGISEGKHGQGEGCKMAKWPCKNCGNIWRDKRGACPTCQRSRNKIKYAKMSDEEKKDAIKKSTAWRKSNTDRVIELKRAYAAKRKILSPINTQRRKDWFPCSCCLAKIGFGSKITAKILGVTPSTVNDRWAKAGIKRYIPSSGTWELNRRRRRNMRNIIRIPLPISLADRKRRRFKGIIETIRRGGSRSVSTLTGCTANQLKKHLDLGMKRGMSWDNYGTHWHVDHILPVASFDHTDPKQVAQCWHWTNLQPLQASKNILKADRITQPQMQLLLCATN